MTRKLISSDHGDDSKRMYDKRFREWKVFKNMNSEQKSKVLKRYTEAGERDAISHEDLRKTLRWARGLPEGRRPRAWASTSASASSSPVVSSPSPPSSLSHGRPSGIPISELVQAGHVPRLHVNTYTSDASPSPSPVPYSVISSEDSYRDGGDLVASPSSATTITTCGRSEKQSVARSADTSPLPSIASLQLSAQTESLLPALSPGGSERSLEAVTRSLRDYFDWQLLRIPAGEPLDAYLGAGTSPESDRFWGDIKNGIYILKIAPLCTESLPRAFPTLAAAGLLAAPALATQPFDFVRNVLAVLSPANTRGHPEVRPILLRLLEREAVHTLGSEQHPVANLCRELQKDDGCQEVSRRALQCLLDVFNDSVGGRDSGSGSSSTPSSSSPAASFKLLDSLATLLRRGGEYDAALEIVVALLTSCRAVFGADSDQARTVENELAHFYMAADQHDLALSHCMAVVRRRQAEDNGSGGGDTFFYQDGIAAHTMEDIADIYVRHGNIEQSLVWLERARTIAIRTWGLTALATRHIIDKMTALQRQLGKDLLQEATKWEAAVAS